MVMANSVNSIRPRRANGATQAFRRPSTTNNTTQREIGLVGVGTSGLQGGVHSSGQQTSNSRNASNVDCRYSKEQLLDLYQPRGTSGASGVNMNDLFLEWNPKSTAQMINGGWSKADDHKDEVTGPDICWDRGGFSHPLGMIDMTEHEIEVSGMQKQSPDSLSHAQ